MIHTQHNTHPIFNIKPGISPTKSDSWLKEDDKDESRTSIKSPSNILATGLKGMPFLDLTDEKHEEQTALCMRRCWKRITKIIKGREFSLIGEKKAEIHPFKKMTPKSTFYAEIDKPLCNIFQVKKVEFFSNAESDAMQKIKPSSYNSLEFSFERAIRKPTILCNKEPKKSLIISRNRSIIVTKTPLFEFIENGDNGLHTPVQNLKNPQAIISDNKQIHILRRRRSCNCKDCGLMPKLELETCYMPDIPKTNLSKIYLRSKTMNTNNNIHGILTKKHSQKHSLTLLPSLSKMQNHKTIIHANASQNQQAHAPQHQHQYQLLLHSQQHQQQSPNQQVSINNGYSSPEISKKIDEEDFHIIEKSKKGGLDQHTIENNIIGIDDNNNNNNCNNHNGSPFESGNSSLFITLNTQTTPREIKVPIHKINYNLDLNEISHDSGGSNSKLKNNIKYQKSHSLKIPKFVLSRQILNSRNSSSKYAMSAKSILSPKDIQANRLISNVGKPCLASKLSYDTAITPTTPHNIITLENTTKKSRAKSMIRVKLLTSLDKRKESDFEKGKTAFMTSLKKVFDLSTPKSIQSIYNNGNFVTSLELIEKTGLGLTKSHTLCKSAHNTRISSLSIGYSINGTCNGSPTAGVGSSCIMNRNINHNDKNILSRENNLSEIFGKKSSVPTLGDIPTSVAFDKHYTEISSPKKSKKLFRVRQNYTKKSIKTLMEIYHK